MDAGSAAKAASVQEASDELDRERREAVAAVSRQILDLVRERPGITLTELVREVSGDRPSVILRDALSELLYDGLLDLSEERALVLSERSERHTA